MCAARQQHFWMRWLQGVQAWSCYCAMATGLCWTKCSSESVGEAEAVRLTAQPVHGCLHARQQATHVSRHATTGTPTSASAPLRCVCCACRTAAGMLQDGSLDTRTYAKRLLWGVKAALRGNRPDMDRLMAGGSKGFDSWDQGMVTCVHAK